MPSPRVSNVFIPADDKHEFSAKLLFGVSLPLLRDHLRLASFRHSCDRLECKFSGLGHLELCWNVAQEGRMKNRCEEMDGTDEEIGFNSRDKRLEMTRGGSEEGRREGGRFWKTARIVEIEKPFPWVQAVTDEIKQQFWNFQAAPVGRERLRTFCLKDVHPNFHKKWTSTGPRCSTKSETLLVAKVTPLLLEHCKISALFVSLSRWTRCWTPIKNCSNLTFMAANRRCSLFSALLVL